MRKILVVGQTPPPFHGQAIMIEQMLNACVHLTEIKHVRMSFSQTIKEVGKFKTKKIIELIKIIFQIWYFRIYHNCEILYYPPTGGNNKVPLYRDFLVLISTRFLFKDIIFHFHASGLSDIYIRLNKIERYLFRKTYFYPTLSIIMTEKGLSDPKSIHSKQIKIIPNGLSDLVKKNNIEMQKNINNPTSILFVGILKESKGVKILVEAVRTLAYMGINFQVNFIGEFESQDFKKEMDSFILDNRLNSFINFLGAKVGEEKESFFYESDIFCFPTFYECENFPNVLIEAMMYSLPIVTSNWRGISSIVKDKYNGYLCPIKTPQEIAEALAILLRDRNLRINMGKNGRYLYEQYYTSEIFAKNITDTFRDIAYRK